MHFQLFSQTASRRGFLRAMPALAVTASAWGEGPAKAGEGFSFLAINDLHYLADDCGRWFRAVVEQMKAEAPQAAFCLLGGDLADRGDAPSLGALKEIFSALGIPIYPVPGNHDFTPDGSREHYDAVFPGRLNYRFLHQGWQFVGLDTTQGTAYDKTSIGAATLAWLEAEAFDREAPTVVCTHFPLGEGVTYRPLNAGAVLERLQKLNLVAVLSGHWHGASERKVEARGHTASLTTSRCCARVRKNADQSPLKGWWLCQAQPSGLFTREFHEFRPPEGIPTEDVAGKKPVTAPAAGAK